MSKTWTIEIGGSSKKYKTISFDRKRDIDSPPTFSATVAYDETINFWDLVEIKRDGTTEFKGYVEGIEIDWGSQDRYLNISGRDASVILWKKYGEGFTEMDEDLGGFFGKVSAVELIKFLLRCPQSDPVSTYPNNKAGWGIDISRITDLSAYRTSAGAPEWTILRKKGLGWRNSGTPFNEAVLEANSAVTQEWSTHGSSPYLTVQGDDNYIYSGTDGQISEWNLQTIAQDRAEHGLPSAEVTSISNPRLQIYWATNWTYWLWIQAEFDCYVWVQSLNAWQFLFHQTGRDLGWTYLEYDLSNIITTIADLNAVKIKFINRSTALYSKIDYCAIAVTYVTSGTQEVNDYFEIDFEEMENVCGVYFESRNDDESYPINYDIVSVLEDLITWDTGWTEVDPNAHISLNAEKTIVYHDNYHAEAAYYYYDYGVGGVSNADWLFAFKLTSSQPHAEAYIPFCLGTNLEKLYDQYNTAGHYLIALFVGDDNGTLTLNYINKDSGGTGNGTALSVSLNTYYYVRFTKSGSNFDIYVYSDASMDDVYLLKHWSDTNDGTLRYRYQALTWGNIEYALRFSDGFEDALTFTRYGGTATAAFDTVDYIEGLRSFKITATADQDYYLEEEVDPTNECYTDFYVKLPSVPSEAVDRDDPDNGVPYGNGMEVDSWTEDGIDGDTLIWQKTGTAPYLNDYGGGDENLVYATAYPEDVGYYKDYWTFENLDAKYQAILRDLGNSGGGHPYCRIRIYAKLYDGVDGHATQINFGVRLWVAHQSAWVSIGAAICNSTSYQIAEFSIGDTLTTLADWNSVKMKIDISSITGGGSHSPTEIDKGGIKITYAVVGFKGTAYWGWVNLAKIYDKDVNGINNASAAIHGALDVRVRDVTANQDKWWWVLWGHSAGYWEVVSTTDYLSANEWHRLKLEVYNNTSGFVKGYEVQGGVSYLRISKTAVNTTGNGTPDCFDVEADCSNQAAGIFRLDLVRWFSKLATHSNGEIDSIGHQELQLATVTNNTFRDCIHSWQPQTLNNLKIKITSANATHGWAISQIYVYYAPALKYRVYLDGLTEPASPPPYLGGPYIKALSFDSSYSTPIGPLNIAMERLIDSINSVVSKCHASYEPYKWWIAYDANNTFHFNNRRGSDKSATISFIKGTNLGGVTRTKSVESTVQRVKIIGRGEGQRQEKVSSDWKEDTTAMDTIRGFYEDVETQKVQANKDLTDLMALIKLKESASIEDQATIIVNNDTYNSMAYDVGDDVTITDSLTGLSGAKTIYNITKDIDENGEQITLVIGKAWETQEDEWADIYRRLKELGIVGTVAEDWSGEGTDKSEVDVTKVSDSWEQSASHEDVEIGEKRTDPQWYKNPDPDSESPPTDGRTIEISGDKLGLYGPNTGTGVQSIEIEMRYDKLTTTAGDLSIEFNIPLTREPKLICEGYCYQVESGDTRYWKEGDYVVFGLYDSQTDVGFLYKIVKGASAFTVYARYKKEGTWIDSPIRTIISNRKYRFEMYYDKTSQAFYWNVYDIENEGESDPVSYVVIKPEMVTVKPLYAKITANHADTTTLWARFYIFRLRTEWSRYEY